MGKLMRSVLLLLVMVIIKAALSAVCWRSFICYSSHFEWLFSPFIVSLYMLFDENFAAGECSWLGSYLHSYHRKQFIETDLLLTGISLSYLRSVTSLIHLCPCFLSVVGCWIRVSVVVHCCRPCDWKICGNVRVLCCVTYFLREL